VRFISKQAYCEIAIRSCGFCEGACKSMEIAFANAGVFGLIEGAVECSTTVACLVISLSSAILCGFIIDNVESLNLKVGESSTPKVVTFIVTLLMAKMMLFPFDLACDTIMHCFVVNEAMAPAKFREEFEKVKKDKDAKKVDGKKYEPLDVENKNGA